MEFSHSSLFNSMEKMALRWKLGWKIHLNTQWNSIEFFHHFPWKI
jgi:hypothetical protein